MDAIENMRASQRHRENINAMSKQTLQIWDVARSTSNLALEQVKANKLQKETNDLLKKQCDELAKRNDILETELKSAKNQNRWSMMVNVITILISIGSLITAILN